MSEVEIERRMQLDLRGSVQEKIQRGYEIVSRDPIRLRRVGCGTQYELRGRVLIETRVSETTDA